MKLKVVSLVLSFAVLVTVSSSASAKPPSPQQVKIVNSASTVKPVSRWRFFSINQDIGNSYTPQQETDWAQIATVSKPYRSNLPNAPKKPFRYWRFVNINEDLGASYTPQQETDWSRLAGLTKPYRS
jgi:hypothetical protein